VIVVAGSRHDPVAVELVRRWPGAALCDAGDLMAPGWRWSASSWSASTSSPAGRRTWVVAGSVVPDADVTGVFVRRSAVYPDELGGTHRDDRAYLASEALALLVVVLATTGAVVVNPVDAGTLGTDALRPERWMRVAAELGVDVAPLRLTNGQVSPRPETGPQPECIVEVVAGEACGDTSRQAVAAVSVAGALGLRWAVAGFDGGGRLCALSTTPAPSPRAADRLGALLGARSGRAA